LEEHELKGVKKFVIKASRWKFEPSVIVVNKGDRVRLIIESLDVSHGFTLDKYGIKAVVNKSEVVEFTATKTGTFLCYCSLLCGSGHGMVIGTRRARAS